MSTFAMSMRHRERAGSLMNSPIVRARSLIVGDMNTAPFSLSGLLQTCRENHALHTQEKVLGPTFGKHGDVCFRGGFTATCLTTLADNHDPDHIPYGICWVDSQLYASGSATEQPLPPWPARSQATAESAAPQRAALSSRAAPSPSEWVEPMTNAPGYATEQPLPPPPMPAPPTPAPMPARSPPMPARSPPMPAPPTLANPQTNAPEYATDQSLRAPPMPASPTPAPMPAPTMPARPPPVPAPATRASNPSPSPTGYEETVAAATEHNERATGPQTDFATREVPADLEMVYSIVNELLGQMTLNNTGR